MNFSSISLFVLLACSLTSAIETVKGTLKNKYRCEKCGACLPIPIPPPPAKGILKYTDSWNATQAKKRTEELIKSHNFSFLEYAIKVLETALSCLKPEGTKNNEKAQKTDGRKPHNPGEKSDNDADKANDKEPEEKPAKEYPEDTKYTILPRRGVPMHPYLDDRKIDFGEGPGKLYNSSSTSASEETSSSSSAHQE